MMKHSDTANDNNKPLGHSDIRAYCTMYFGRGEYLLVSGLFFNFPNFGPFLAGVRQHPYSTLVSNLALHKLWKKGRTQTSRSVQHKAYELQERAV
jgi:hypothetical protein